MKVSAEVVKGQCPTCTEHTILVCNSTKVIKTHVDKPINIVPNNGTTHPNFFI
jgi:hypothetical protein